MQLRILDKGLIARLCRRAEEWEGSWRKAAWQMDVGAGTFWRLRAAAGGPTIQSRTFDAFYGYLPPDHVSLSTMAKWDRDLGAAVLCRRPYEALVIYENWLRRELRRFARWDRSFQMARPRSDGKDLFGACRRVLKVLLREYPAEFAPLARLTSRGQRRTDRLRDHLAYLRIAEPLVAFEATNGIELGPEELAKRDRLRPYLRAAVRRETIFLERAADIERAQEMASPPRRGGRSVNDSAKRR